MVFFSFGVLPGPARLVGLCHDCRGCSARICSQVHKKTKSGTFETLLRNEYREMRLLWLSFRINTKQVRYFSLMPDFAESGFQEWPRDALPRP
jgi:hypothetical protein